MPLIACSHERSIRVVLVSVVGVFVFLHACCCNAYAESLQSITWSPECPKGSAEAEAFYQLGIDYQKSRKGIIGDRTQAAMYFEKAIQGGNAKAALAYGRMLRTATPFGEAHEELPLSVEFYKLGAAMNCPEAWQALGRSLFIRLGCPQKSTGGQEALP